MKKLVIIGASGHGKVIADIALKVGYTDIVFLDDNESLTECGGYPVVGKVSEYYKYNEFDSIVAIGRATTRKRIQDTLKKVATLIHPAAVIGKNVTIGNGTVVMAGAVINPNTQIGNGCIVNTCSSVDHDCNIGDFVHVSVGAHIAGTVNVGEMTWIGAGATVSNNINICADCMIGAGAVVVSDITESGTYIGIPAKKKAD